MAILQTPSIAAVVEDQSPQLGGNLETNGNYIIVQPADAIFVENANDGLGNYERLEVKWDANEAVISTTAAGTGIARGIKLQNTGGNFAVDASSSINISAGGAVTR